MDVSDEDDEEGFGSRFSDDVGEEKEERFSFYDDVVEEEEEEEEEDFASDFYKAGSGWSSLVADEEADKDTPENKMMKQANLFQIWGLQKITPETNKKNVKQTNLFQIWGLQKPSPSTSPASSSAKKTTASRKRLRDFPLTNDSPRQCPFYKKLPGWDDISKNLSTDGKATCLHVLPMSALRVERLHEHVKDYKEQYGAVLAFRSTDEYLFSASFLRLWFKLLVRKVLLPSFSGWTYKEKIGEHLDLIKPTSSGKITIYGVPYSEHSSFTELREFVQFLRQDKIIPTVNILNAGSGEKMQSCFREWLRR